RIAAGMDMVERLDLGIAGKRDGAISRCRKPGECRLELAEALDGAFGAAMLVMIEQHFAHYIGHRDDGVDEMALVPAFRGAALALRGIGIDILAREAVQRGDHV